MTKAASLRPAPGGETPAAELVGVTRRYSGGGGDQDGAGISAALRDVTMRIPRSGMVVVTGPSGSGKTTLLNLLGCIDPPDEGRVLIDGRDTAALGDRRLSALRAEAIGFVFQNFNLMPTLSAAENVEYPLQLLGIARAERRARALDALDAVGLSAFAHRRPGQLSGGQKQRTAIARALVKRPRLVLADEPTANLDWETGRSVLALLERLQRDAETTVVLCTHDREVADRFPHRVAMRDGLVVESTLDQAA